MRLVILGGPGAGKGTQAQQLCSNLSIPLLALGGILREAIASETDLGKLAMPDARCPIPDARCPIPYYRFPITYVHKTCRWQTAKSTASD